MILFLNMQCNVEFALQQTESQTSLTFKRVLEISETAHTWSEFVCDFVRPVVVSRADNELSQLDFSCAFDSR
jgi:hypothetical protein